MFYTDKDGWCPIREAYLAFSSAADENPDTAEDEENTRAESSKQRHERELQEERLKSKQILLALRCLRQFGVLLPSGFVATATRALVSVPVLKGSKTSHVDLMVGTVGSGTRWDTYSIASDEDPALHKIELERAYGIFLGCPVMVKVDEVDKAIRSEFPWQTAGFDFSLEQQAKRDEAQSKRAEAGRGPGAPGWYDGHAKRHVYKHFRPLIGPGGKLEKVSRESVYQDAFNWINKLLDEEIPLNTIEDWVRALYKEVGNKSQPESPNSQPGNS